MKCIVLFPVAFSEMRRPVVSSENAHAVVFNQVVKIVSDWTCSQGRDRKEDSNAIVDNVLVLAPVSFEKFCKEGPRLCG